MMELSIFHDKLNKVDGKVYVIEEEIRMPDTGIYEAELQHDNIVDSTLAVYTGPTLTGEQINTYALSTPSLMPWKRIIRIQTDKKVVYISYETDGDTVEAQDINIVQDAILVTQGGVNAEEARARSAEVDLARDLQLETDRATGEEQRLDIRIDTEAGRAQVAENALSVRLNAETERAEAAEQENSDAIAAEAERAVGAEKKLADNLTGEISRAKAAEEVNADNITAESSRATAAENKNAEDIKAETTRAESAEASIRSTINTNKPIWDDKYTRNEVDNKFSTLETAIDWKEAVNSFADLATAYPKPDDGWTVNVKDTDYTYRWSGTEWVAISANAIPKATQSVDGLLSKEDKAYYDDAYSKRHTHSNKGIIDKITQSLLDAWNAAYTHISDTVKHVTEAERNNWDDAYSKRHTHSNKGVIDKLTQAMLDKLSGIAAGAEVNVQSDWNTTDTGSDAYIKNKPSSMPASDVKAWAKAAEKPAYIWTEIGGRPSSFPPMSHTHTKSQITDMPTRLSQFTNDAGYLTSADVDTSQNHTHANKSILDSISQPVVDKWNSVSNKVDKETGKGLSSNDFTTALLGKLNGIAAEANKYVHPTISGNKHIPSGGASGQILKWSADGTAAWGAPETGYTHPNSGVSTGTYKSVTVNAQGHVTGGSNPNTLAGYGITDAAAKNHNHDTVYIKKGAVTWNDLKGS